MDYSTYLMIALVAGGRVFGFACSVFQDAASRFTESTFDSIECALATSRERRAAAQQYEWELEQMRHATARRSSVSQWARHGHSAA